MSDIFGNDRFEKILKSALRGAGLRIENKDGNVYSFSDGANVLSADISSLRDSFSESENHLLLSAFAVELSNKFELEKKLASFTAAQSMLRLLLVTDEEVYEDIISAPFAGKIKKAVGICDDGGELSLLEERFLRKWNVPRDVLFSVADRNMGRLLSKAKYNLVRITDSVDAIEFEAKGDPLAVSFVLCTDFRLLAEEKLGKNFLAAVPSTETMMAVPDIPPKLLSSLREAVFKDYSWADSPVTTDIIRFSSDKAEVI